VLELWASGTLAYSYNAMLLPPTHTPVVEELKAWVGREVQGQDLASIDSLQDLAFIDNLLAWTHFQSAALKGSQGDPSTAEQMPGVGLDLLAHSRRQGLTALTGIPALICLDVNLP
jgi:hypothetical protein